MAKTVSDETQAIIDRLKREGDLIRNSGANSIKGVRVELAKFHTVFSEMKQSLSGLSSQSANAANLAKQLANSQAQQQQQNQAATQAQQAAQQQQAQQQQTKNEKEKRVEKRERTSWMKTIKSYFGKIFDFFKKAALFLVGGAFAYEFIAGMIEEKFGIDMPTVAETLKNFKKTVDNFTEADWESAKLALTNIGLLAAGIAAFGTALGLATTALSAIAAWRPRGVPGRFPGRSPAGVPGSGPIVNPGGAGAGGRQPTPTTTAPPGTNRADLRRQWAMDKRNRVVPRNTSFQDWLAQKNPTTPTTPAPTTAPPTAGPGWWDRMKTAAGRAKGPALVTGAVTAYNIAAGGAGQPLLDGNQLEEELLAAIEGRSYDTSDVVKETLVGAGLSAGIGGTIGIAGGPAGIAAGAISGAIWGGISSLASSSILALRRVYRDAQEEGIDEIPNTVERALRNEISKKGTEEFVSAMTETAEKAKEFLDKYGEELVNVSDEIEAQQKIIEANTLSPPEINAAKKRLEELEERRALLETQVRSTENILYSRFDKLPPEIVDRLTAPVNDPLAQLVGPNNTQLEQLAQLGASMAPQQFFFTQGSPINNFNNTSVNRANSVAYRSNVGSVNAGGSYSDHQAIPAMFS